MKRINVYITEFQQKELKRISKNSGIKFSEMLRRILDDKLKPEKKDTAEKS